jgi:hypothetical protein
MKAILFLGTSLVGAQYISDAVLELGYRPIFLLNIEDYSGDPRRAIESCEYYKADVNSLDDILRAINEHPFMDEVVAVTSLLDETLHNACSVANQFKIAGPDAALAQLIDKAAVRKIIPEFSPPSITISLQNISEESIRDFFSKHKTFNEFLLKPGISSGAVGITLLNKFSTSEQIKNIIRESKIENAEQQNWIIQPRLKGRLHSLEGYVSNGQIFFLGFSRRVRKELTETASEYPVDNDIEEHLQKNCQKTVETLIQRSGYMNGYFHCEFIINSDAAYFIDGNMGRVAGAAIVQQIALVYGKNPIEIYKHVFDLGLFNGVHTQDFTYKKITMKRTLSINYCIPETAIVLGVKAPENLVSFHTQIVAGDGKQISGAGVSDSSWVGFLAGFKENVIAEINELVIQTTKGSVAPFYMLTEELHLKAIEGNH